MNKLPSTVKDLVETLHFDTPHRCPGMHMTEREIWVYAGRRQLVDDLIGLATDAGIKLDLKNLKPQDDDEGD